jgi:hypothetical protein
MQAQIWEYDMMDPKGGSPLFKAVQEDRTLRTLLSIYLPSLNLGRGPQAVKAQVNEGGGGAFPIHFDSDEQLDGRRVTAILYLNEGELLFLIITHFYPLSLIHILCTST